MIPAHHKVFIGAIGALCLSVLKLINANFYLGVSNASSAWGAYLTYGCYLFLGMAVGYFFCEETPDVQKTRKSAFLMGLLAPSILLALISKPVDTNVLNSAKSGGVPDLPGGGGGGSVLNLLFPSAYAQPAFTNPPAALWQFKTITKDDVVPGFGDGVRSALGVQRLPQDPVVFVVGKTAEKTVATNTAAQIEHYFNKTRRTDDLKVVILKPDDTDQYFVTVGALNSPGKVSATEQRVKSAVMDSFGNTLERQEKATAELLLKGDIYKGTALFKNK